jgi:CheY-like chemotaxis protein
MREIIGWLSDIEKSSSSFYKKLSSMTQNENLKIFLLKLSNDESEHYRYMSRGLSLLEEKNIDVNSDIIMDQKTKDKIEKLISFSDDFNGYLGDEDIYDRIITIEFSEWNDIFLYVTVFLKRLSVEYQAAASDIQKHLDRIKLFFKSDGIDKKYYDRITGFDTVWETRILIVDDTESIVSFLNLFCRRFGVVDIAYNGAEAFKKTKMNYYDLIISDIDMPLCNGIEFYIQHSKNDVGLKEKFIFMSGNSPPEFIVDKGIYFLKKPFSIDDLNGKIKSVFPWII